jgi:hypothetical protein
LNKITPAKLFAIMLPANHESNGKIREVPQYFVLRESI